eukprot:Opistho-2@73507
MGPKSKAGTPDGSRTPKITNFFPRSPQEPRGPSSIPGGGPKPASSESTKVIVKSQLFDEDSSIESHSQSETVFSLSDTACKVEQSPITIAASPITLSPGSSLAAARVIDMDAMDESSGVTDDVAKVCYVPYFLFVKIHHNKFQQKFVQTH